MFGKLTARKSKSAIDASSSGPEINGMASLQSSINMKNLNYISDNLQASKLAKFWANKETKVVNILRVAVVASLIVAASIVAAGVIYYTRQQEQDRFELEFSSHGHQIVDSFHSAIERHIASGASLSNAITSYAITSTPSGFPFVTLPHFEILGSDVRAQSGSHLIHWAPLVTDSNRPEWERYAYENRQHAKEAGEADAKCRDEQDAQYGYGTGTRRSLVQEQEAQQQTNETLSTSESASESWDSLVIPLENQGIPGIRPTILDDGYHPRIWSSSLGKAPIGDMPEGAGHKYLPLWQRSAVDRNLSPALNVDLMSTPYLAPDLIDTMEREQRAILNFATEPIPDRRATFEYFLSVSQYRHRSSEVSNDWHTPLAYPVFDSFDTATKKLAGIITMDMYWKAFFSNLLPPDINGVLCVIENSFGQSFSYQIDGKTATVLGSGDQHDPKYNGLVISTNVNSHLKERAGPENRAYKTVHLSDTVQYTLRVYPSQATQDIFITNQPAVLAAVVLMVFCFAVLVFLMYSYVVEKRQRVMNDNVIENVKKAAETERELNEFLSHEIRNPLSAAISACTFVSTAVNEADPLADEESRTYVRDDIEVVNSSLHFINDFMRSMLDIYRASGNKITVEKAPCDIKHDILMPVSNILYKRLASYDVIVDCPDNVVVMTDSIRLKQVVLNLVRNASKFIEHGFLRMRAEVVVNGSESKVVLYIEDSGPGVPEEKKHKLFAKYQDSLDLLSQGTGIGLNLSKKLMYIMGGSLYLDQHYDSGVEGSPGACFVIDLNTAPLDLEHELDVGDFDYSEPVDIESGMTKEAMGQEQEKHDADTGRTDSSCGDTPPSLRSARQKPRLLLSCSRSQSFGANEPVPELPENISVLFVDDDAMLRKLFVRAVKRVTPDSWTINEASSGEMALKICGEDSSIDIIFMDQYMASVDKQMLGTETVQALRRKGVESKIVGLSANDLRTSFINNGADDFILKPMPCKPHELKHLLFDILNLGMMDSSSKCFSFPPSAKIDKSIRSSSNSIPEGPLFPTTVQVSLSSPLSTGNQPSGQPLPLFPVNENYKEQAQPLPGTTGAAAAPLFATIGTETKQQPPPPPPPLPPLFSIPEGGSQRERKPVPESSCHHEATPLFSINNGNKQAETQTPSHVASGPAVQVSPLFSIKMNGSSNEGAGNEEKTPLFATGQAANPPTPPPLFTTVGQASGPEQAPRINENERVASPLFDMKGSDGPKQSPPLFDTKASDKPNQALPLFAINGSDKQHEAPQEKALSLFSIGIADKQKQSAPLFEIKGPDKQAEYDS